MRIFLNPENPGHLGDDTFWFWFKREFPSSIWGWQGATDDDLVLQYSVLGPAKSRYVALCWEMYPEMQERLPRSIGDWADKAARCQSCAGNTPFRTVPTVATEHFYSHHGPVKVLPLGVDTEVFKPLHAKKRLREKYGIPQDRPVGFWSGTTHYMKGYDLLEKVANENPSFYWILCWKQPSEAGHREDAHNTVSILQPHMNELMNCADFFFSTGRLNPLYLVEWEALSAGLHLVNAPGITRELPDNSNRDAVFDLGWDRLSLRAKWLDWLAEIEATS